MLCSDEKSDVLSIRKRKGHLGTDVNMTRISMEGVLVHVCLKHKHIGVQFNNSLSWSDHIDELYTAAACTRKIGMLCSLRKRVSTLCLTQIDIRYIRPRLEYASAIWSGGSASKLCCLHQRFCRRHQERQGRSYRGFGGSDEPPGAVQDPQKSIFF